MCPARPRTIGNEQAFDWHRTRSRANLPTAARLKPGGKVEPEFRSALPDAQSAVVCPLNLFPVITAREAIIRRDSEIAEVVRHRALREAEFARYLGLVEAGVHKPFHRGPGGLQLPVPPFAALRVHERMFAFKPDGKGPSLR